MIIISVISYKANSITQHLKSKGSRHKQVFKQSTTQGELRTTKAVTAVVNEKNQRQVMGTGHQNMASTMVG